MDQYFEELYLTNLFNEKLKNSRAKGIDKLNANSFLSHMDDSIASINLKVLDNTYNFSPYIEILKLKGRNKYPRVIAIPTIRDRLVLLAMKEMLHELFPNDVNRTLPNSYIRDIKKYIATHGDINFIKFDITNFYGTINHEKLLGILENKNVDIRLRNLIGKAVNTPTIPQHSKRNSYDKYLPIIGIPQGLSISNILAQIYLSNFDTIMKKRSFFYRRYVDDILVMNQGEISKFREQNIVKPIIELSLELNNDKNEKGLLSSGFNFLSYKILDTNISIADKNIEVFIRRIAAKFTWFKNGINDKNKRPVWLQNNIRRYKTVFLEELNETITGVISYKKNYGWLFYFSEMDDLNILFKIDKIIDSFFLNEPSFGKSPKKLKRLVRAYHVIKFEKNKNYIANYDSYKTIRQKRNYLIFRGIIDPGLPYTDIMIISLFEKFRNKQLKKLEKDIGYNYF